jgi:acyl-ACP thioesterase
VTLAPFTALAEPPGIGRAYTERVRAGIDATGPTGRARLDAIARWLQDAAYFDLVDAGFPRPAPWIVRRLRIQVQRFPVLGEPLRLTTWCSALGKAVAERRTSLHGDDGARIETVAQWIAVDPATGGLAPLNEEFHALFAPSAAGRRSRTRLHHPPEPPPDAIRRPFAFRATDLDAVGHVNNAAYWAVLEEELAGLAADAPIDAEVEHRAAAGAQAVEVHAAGNARWVVAGDEVVATFVLGR